ncbi:MAG: C-terminal binding protein [Alphaproteobacteria bacterium]|nr:C-terminal binding protein [Alphaproteobacteria bacterium]
MSEQPIVVVAGCELPNDLALERERLEPIGAEIVDARDLPDGPLMRQLERASALLTEGFMALDRAVLRRLERCRIISFYSTGIETIDLDAASEMGIQVINAPGYCTEEVADHAMLLLLAVGRKLTAATRIAASRSWKIDDLRPINGLHGQTLGLLGYGEIARAVAARARAFGVEIIAHDPYVAPDIVATERTRLVPLNALFSASDAVSIHLPLTPETNKLVGREQIALLREGAVLVNTSRGGVIDEDALVAALANDHIAGASLDVLASEPADAPGSRRLLELENVICTPHMAYYSEDSLRNLRAMAADAVADSLMGRSPPAQRWANRRHAAEVT